MFLGLSRGYLTIEMSFVYIRFRMFLDLAFPWRPGDDLRQSVQKLRLNGELYRLCPPLAVP
jgi:hypothetical protein